MSTGFEGRLAVVTGASRGIGRAVALALAEAGAHVIAVARTTGALEELDDAIRGIGGATLSFAPTPYAIALPYGRGRLADALRLCLPLPQGRGR